jgi:predicted DNA-binding transcriptional regulator AlpA
VEVGRVDAGVVTLEDISREPLRARGLSPDTIATLLAQCGGAQGALLAALASSNGSAQAPNQENRLLTVGEAAAKLAVKPEWLYRRGKRLGLAVKLGDGTLRFSNSALDGYIRENTAGIAIRRRRKTAAFPSCNEEALHGMRSSPKGGNPC